MYTILKSIPHRQVEEMQRQVQLKTKKKHKEWNILAQNQFGQDLTFNALSLDVLCDHTLQQSLSDLHTGFSQSFSSFVDGQSRSRQIENPLSLFCEPKFPLHICSSRLDAYLDVHHSAPLVFSVDFAKRKRTLTISFYSTVTLSHFKQQ